jgi:probable HAF family extracellular repeat protein
MRSFIYDGLTFREFVAPQYFKTVALDMNDRGEVVGYWEDARGTDHAFFFDGSEVRPLNALSHDYSIAAGINNAGQAVGASRIGFSDGPVHAFLYDNGTMTSLGSLFPDARWTGATGISDNGYIVGSAGRAFRYSPATGVVDLGTLSPQAPTGSSASAVNRHGQVVGTSEFSDEPYDYHAFLYTDEAGMTDLTPPGIPESYAYDINDDGFVVGSLSEYLPNGSHRGTAFLYDGTATLDLNLLADVPAGWFLESARDINSLGQILTTAHEIDGPPGSYRHFLLTPIPEPFGVALMASGTWMVLCRTRRR